MQVVRAFVSSTWLDLEPERQAVEQLIQRFDLVRFAGMEYFGSRVEDTRTTSLIEVDRSELYIGIYGHRYGSGITEAEYRRARDRRLPCLLYFKGGTPSEMVDDASALEALKTELRTTHTVTDFSSPSDLAAKLAADLHRWLFDRYITQGIAALSAPFAERIQSFLAEYTGTVDQPIPFGGRDADLRQLTEWLADVNGAPLLVLAAPAGRGKSALLVHWSRAVVANEDVAVVFFPISIRFNTNLAQAVFPALAARLASLHGEPLQVPSDATIDLWRSLLANYLGRPLPDGRRLLVIIDGIDEAADWEAGPDLFPRTLAHGTRIAVSARFLPHLDAAGWARRLGCDGPGQAYVVTLDPLSAAGVADVLDHFGLELRLLSSRVDVVAELHRLSGGDPLLVRLYVTALSADRGTASRLEPEDLSHIRPGLEGFFTRWWDDQRRLWGASTPLRESAVQALLNLLACALGPLQRTDLLQLSPPEANLNAWTLDDALKPISRFVIGNGIEQGYAFSHPRLGSYFYDRLAQAGQAREQEHRFVSWGQRILAELREHRIAAGEVPLYLVQYLRAHLERTACGVAAMGELVSFAWLTAWSALDKGSFTGFLADVRRIWLAAEQADAAAAQAGKRAEFLDLEIRCALCLSSVISMAADIPTAFLRWLVQRGVWTPAQGLAYASNKPIPQLRVEALLELGSVVPAAQRDPLLGAALSAARAVVEPDQRDRLLVRVSEWLDEPLAALRHVEDRKLRLQEVATRATAGPARQVDVVVRALEDASTEPDLRQRLMWTQALGTHLPEPHRSRAAKTFTETAEMLLDRGDDLEIVLDAAVSLSPGLIERCKAEIDRGPASARLRRISRLATLTSGDVQERVLAAGLEAIRASAGDEQRLKNLSDLLWAYPEDKLETVDPILDGFERDQQRMRAEILLWRRAGGHRRGRRFQHVLDGLASWPDGNTRTSFLLELAPYLMRAEATHILGVVAAQTTEVQRAFVRRSRLEDCWEIAEALEDLARAAIERQRDPIERARLACRLASQMVLEAGNDAAANRLFAMALDAVSEVEAEDQRARLLMELAVFAPFGSQLALFQFAEALPDARWAIVIVLEMVICGAEGNVPVAAYHSAYERLEDADTRARAEMWASRLRVIERRAEPAPPPVRSTVPRRHEIDRSLTPPSAERTAEIFRILESLVPVTTLPGTLETIESVKSEVALLAADVFQNVLDSISGWESPDVAAAVCRVIADECADLARRQHVLATAAEILLPVIRRGAMAHFQALLEMAPELAPEPQAKVLIEALKVAGESGKSGIRDDVLGVILSLSEPAPALVAFAIEDNLAKLSLTSLRELTARLPTALLPRALAAALQIDSAFADDALRGILSAVRRPPWDRVFDIVLEVPEESTKARALARLAEHADNTLLRPIVDAMQQLRDPLTRVRALTQIVPLVAGELLEQTLAAGWAAVKGAVEDAEVIDALTRGTAGATIHHALLPAAVATVMTLLDQQLRARTIETLAPYLSADLLEQALKGFQVLRDDAERTRTLTALLVALESTDDRGAVADIAARTGRGIPWADRRALQLAALAQETDGAQREDLLRDALAAIRLTPERSRVEALLEVSTALDGGSETMMAEALSLVDRLPQSANESGTSQAPKAEVLRAILPNLATPFLVKAYAVGGAGVASPLERIRLLTYLARDVELWNSRDTTEQRTVDEMTRGLEMSKLVDRVVGSDPDAVERLAMLLKCGPLALAPPHLRAADLEPRFWPEEDRLDQIAGGFERALSLGVAGLAEVTRLAPYLDAPLARTVLQALHLLGDEMLRAAALRRVAPFLPPELLPDALSIVRTLSETDERAATLIRLLPLLPQPIPSGALARIRSLVDPVERAWLLRTIALRAAGPRQESLVREALEAVRAIDSATERSRLIIDLAARLPSPLLPLAIASIQTIDDPEHETNAFIEIVPRVTGGDASHMVSAVAQIADEEHRAVLLYAIARFGCDELLADSLRMTASVTNSFRRSLLISAFAPRLTPAVQPLALGAAVTIPNASARIEAVSAIAEHASTSLPHEVLIDVCGDLWQITDDAYRSALAKPVWRHLPTGDFARALGFVDQIKDEHVRAEALRSLMELASEEWFDGLKDRIGRLKDAHYRAILLAEFASRLSPLERAICIDEALASVTLIPHRQGRADALREMAARVPDPDAALLEHAVRSAIAVRRVGYAVEVIEQLAPRFDERLATEAIDYAHSLEDESMRIRIIGAVADRLQPQAVAQLLSDVRMLQRQVQRRDLLSVLAPCITEHLWPLAVDTAAANLPESYQADVLIVFAEYMSDTARPLAWAAANRLKAPEAATKALWGLAYMTTRGDVVDENKAEPTPLTTAPASVPTDLIDLFAPVLRATGTPPPPSLSVKHRHCMALTRLRLMQSELDRVATIRSLAPQLQDDEAVSTLELIDELSEASNRAAALRALAPHASLAVVPRIWQSLRRIPDTALYESVLAPLAPRLSQLPAPEAHALCAEIIRVLAGGRRGILLDGIRTLVPVITALGHQREIVDTAVSINEVGTWWP